MFHTRFSGFHYFLFVDPSLVSVVCPNETQYHKISGHLALYISFSLHSTVLQTYPEKLHKGFVSSNALPVYPLAGLTGLNFSTVNFVTNTLEKFSFSNKCDLQEVIEDALPAYLAPTEHFPSFVVPVVVSYPSASPCLVC